MTEATITAIALDPREIIKDMVASFVGSAACVYTGQPFDTVKVRLQCATPGQYRGTIDCSRYIIANEGVLKLFSGSLPALTGALLENATAFAVNGTLKRFLGDRDKVKFEDKPFYEPFLTGGITGFTVAFVLCPCDMLKCRAQVSKSKGLNHSIREIIEKVVQQRGLLGLYSGMTPQITRDIMFYGSFFGSYEVLCAGLKKYTDMPDAAVYGTAGGLAGQIAWACSIIPDSVKSHIQTSPSLTNLPGSVETFRRIVKEKGYRGLFAGIEVAIIRAWPANAALFLGYEYTKKLLDKLVT